MNLCEAIKMSQTASTCRIKRKNWYKHCLEVPIILECLIHEIDTIEYNGECVVCDDGYLLHLGDALADDWEVIT